MYEEEVRQFFLNNFSSCNSLVYLYFPTFLDTLFAIAQLFAEPFLAQPFAVLHQVSFLIFAGLLWIEVSLHIAEKRALQPATLAAETRIASSPLYLLRFG